MMDLWRKPNDEGERGGREMMNWQRKKKKKKRKPETKRGRGRWKYRD
jgi:hypothetical protein